MTGLTIRVLDIERDPRPFRLQTDDAWWERSQDLFNDPDTRLIRPFELNLDAYCLGRRLLFRGGVSGEAELSCGRCLETFRLEFQEPLQLLLEPFPTAEAPAQPGIELDAEDFELGRYSGEELDFEPVLRDLLLVSWPMAPRCDEGCQGLCPVCGENRNARACQCDTQGANKPFAALGNRLRHARDDSS